MAKKKPVNTAADRGDDVRNRAWAALMDISRNRVAAKAAKEQQLEEARLIRAELASGEHEGIDRDSRLQRLGELVILIDGQTLRIKKLADTFEKIIAEANQGRLFDDIETDFDPNALLAEKASKARGPEGDDDDEDEDPEDEDPEGDEADDGEPDDEPAQEVKPAPGRAKAPPARGRKASLDEDVDIAHLPVHDGVVGAIRHRGVKTVKDLVKRIGEKNLAAGDLGAVMEAMDTTKEYAEIILRAIADFRAGKRGAA